MFACNAVGPVAHPVAETWSARLAKRCGSPLRCVISRGPLAGGAYQRFCLSGAKPVDNVSAARAERDLPADLRAFLSPLALEALGRRAMVAARRHTTSC